MVKGVNKNIIEIVDTGNDCFERAILFVRPQSQKLGGDVLRRRAGDYLRRLRIRPGIVARRRLLSVIKLTAAFALGLTLALLLLQM